MNLQYKLLYILQIIIKNEIFLDKKIAMDRNLVGNHKFWLSDDSSYSNDGKIYVFVKLTDSCMKTIETHVKLNKKQNLSNKSNIKFNHNEGVIYFK